MIIFSSMCTTAAANLVPSPEPYYVMSSGCERIYSGDLCFSISVPSRVQYILHSYGSCSGVVSSLCNCVGSSHCLGASRWHSCISVVHSFRFPLLIVVCNGWFTFPLIFRYNLTLLSFALCSVGNMWSSCLIILVLVPRGTPRIRRIPWFWETCNLSMLLWVIIPKVTAPSSSVDCIDILHNSCVDIR